MRKFLIVLIVSLIPILMFSVRYGGTLVYVMGVDAVTLLPGNMTDNPSEMVCRHIFEGLVEFDEKLNINPALAERWEISKDGTVYTFYLRKGVKFQDGTPFNAYAVKKYFEYVLTHDLKRTKLYEPYIKEIKVIDDYTVQFVLKHPFGPFLNYLAHGAGLIVSPKAIDEYGDDPGVLGKHPVGTGPFKLAEWKKGEKIVLVKNENYWQKGKPYLDKIVFRVIPEAVTRALQLQAGDAHLALKIPPVFVEKLKKDPRIDVVIGPSLRVLYIGMNTQKKPFDDVRIRRALNYAIDKETLCKTIMGGLAKPADSPLAPAIWGYYSTGKYPYDPEKAKKLLAEAGYPNGFEAELATPKGRYLQDYETAVAVQAQLAKVGVKVKVVPMEWATYLAYVNVKNPDKRYQMFLLGWAPSTGEADWVLRPLFSTGSISNRALYSNPEVDELIVKASREVDPEKRKELYKILQEKIVDDAPWIFLYVLDQVYAKSKKVKGDVALPIEIVLVKDAWLEE